MKKFRFRQDVMSPKVSSVQVRLFREDKLRGNIFKFQKNANPSNQTISGCMGSGSSIFS